MKKPASACLVLAMCITFAVPAAADRLATRTEDPRLQQKVDARAVDQPLTTWLAQLGGDRGVSLNTATDYEDRLITLRAKDLALGELLDAIAALYGDRWIARGERNHSSYRLTASEARRTKQRLLTDAFQRALLSEMLETVRDTAKNGPPATMGIPAEDTELRDRFKAQANVLSQLSPDTVSAIFSGQPLRIDLPEAEGAMGDALRSFVERYATPEPSPLAQPVAWVQFSARRYSWMNGALRGVPLQGLDFTFGHSSTGGSMTFGLIVDPNALTTRLQKEVDRLRQGEEQDPEDRRRRGGSALQRQLSDTSEFAPSSDATRSRLLVAVAETADLNLVSDAHTKPPPPPLDLRKQTAESALSAIGEAYDCFWRFDHSIVKVRSKYWWLDDVAEPPATAVVRWKKMLGERGYLPMKETLEIATLSPDQQERLVDIHQPRPKQLLPEASAAFDRWFRFYASLDARERAAATSPKGLPFWTVPEIRRRRLINTFTPSHGGIESAADLGTILGAAAILRVTEDATRLMRSGPPAQAENEIPHVATFQIEPVRDADGYPRGLGMGAVLPLPRREPPKPPLSDRATPAR